MVNLLTKLIYNLLTSTILCTCLLIVSGSGGLTPVTHAANATGLVGVVGWKGKIYVFVHYNNIVLTYIPHINAIMVASIWALHCIFIFKIQHGFVPVRVFTVLTDVSLADDKEFLGSLAKDNS